MRNYSPIERLWVVPAVLAFLSACQQVDQSLPFELEDGAGATVTIGTNGGIVSVPPSFSMEFPAGGYSGPVTVFPRIDAPFPGDAGLPVPGTAFDIGPVGTALPVPARVELAVPIELLEVGEEVRLVIALLRDDGSVATFSANYDVTNGILSAEIDELGPVAAVLMADAIAIGEGVAPALSGGSFSPPTPAPPVPGASLTSHGGVEFTASCSPDAQFCFSSGIVQIWVDDVVRARLGESLFLVGAEVDAHLDFLTFDQSGQPTSVIGEIRIGGELRARIGSIVTNEEVDDFQSTGAGTGAIVTSVTLVGTTMTLAETTNEINAEFEYTITGIGTSELLTIQLEIEIEFDNDDDSVEIGVVTAHLRLRR